MGRVTKKALSPIVIPACCFAAGVVLTLLYSTLAGNTTVQQQAGATVSSHVSFGNSTGEALGTATGSLSRHDLVMTIPSSIARYGLCPITTHFLPSLASLDSDQS